MSRPLRIQYPNALYHITSRGNARGKIFLNDKDFQTFLSVLLGVIKRYNWICYAYCLMPNHYHLLVETPESNLAEGMRQLNGVYTQKFNFFHRRVGHIFQGRYKAILIEKDQYLGEVMRYIVLNPVRAKLIKSPSQWKWSSHNELAGVRHSIKCIDVKKALKIFDSSPTKARKYYFDFINQKCEINIWDELKGGVLLGTAEFAEKLLQYFKKQGEKIEIPRKERLAHRQKLNQLFSKQFSSKGDRNKLIYRAYMDYGYSLSEIGRELKLHYSAISKIIKKLEAKKS